MKKLHIEKNSVQETLVIPLYARSKCSSLYPEIFKDDTAEKLMARVDYDFSVLDKKQSFFTRFAYLEAACRQNDIAVEVKEYLSAHPYASVVNVGCGLDCTAESCDNGYCKIYNVDFEDVISLRNKLVPKNERTETIATDVNGDEWLDVIDGENGVIFFAMGVLYYFTQKDALSLAKRIADKFEKGVFVFDAANAKAVRLMVKTLIKQAKIDNVDAFFSVNDVEKDFSDFCKHKVSAKGYMLGYTDLKFKSVSPLYRALAKVADGKMGMKIIKIEF